MLVLQLLATGLLGILLGAKIGPSLKKQRKVSAMAEKLKLPFDLGLKEDVEYSLSLNNFRIKLENSLDSTFLEQVKKRVLEKIRWSDKEFDVYLFGVKQFFLLNAFLKSVPMFSKEMDEIWYEMLMFTREYQAFCENFIGEMIHHEPAISQEKMMTGALRAEFDWLYSQFFEINGVGNFIYKGFCHFKLDEKRINELEKMTVAEIQRLYFKENEAVQPLAKVISTNLIVQIEQAKKQKGVKNLKNLSSNDENFVIFSLFGDDNPRDHKHDSGTGHHSGNHHSDSTSHHSCSSHSGSSHSCSSCSSCSS